jgi:hypothetical protein
MTKIQVQSVGALAEADLQPKEVCEQLMQASARSAACERETK